MTTPYSSAFSKICSVENSGYGYFWWINSWPDVSELNYSAKGNLGKYIIVFPDRKISIICQIHTEAPDNSKNETTSTYTRFNNLSDSQMSELIITILSAHASMS